MHIFDNPCIKYLEYGTLYIPVSGSPLCLRGVVKPFANHVLDLEEIFKLSCVFEMHFGYRLRVYSFIEICVFGMIKTVFLMHAEYFRLHRFSTGWCA